MCSEKYAFMFLENDYDRLMDSIEQYDTYGYNFEKYEKELKKALPGRVKTSTKALHLPTVRVPGYYQIKIIVLHPRGVILRMMA